ncbi:MAG: aminopeptidase, partial [Gammaproteobacteria bacterium]
EQAAAKLRARGLDVAVSPATAYSTLGWFEDPVLDTMFSGGASALAGTLFHELAHRRIYVRGDTAFNESYARFVELEGVAAWLTAGGKTGEADAWRRRQRLTDAFLELLTGTRSALGALYAVGGEPAELRLEKAGILEQLQANYRRDFGDPATGNGPWDGFFEPPPNNADLALLAQYEDGRCAFAALFRDRGSDWREFHAAVESIARRDDAARRDWLAQGC